METYWLKGELSWTNSLLIILFASSCGKTEVRPLKCIYVEKEALTYL